MRSFLCYVYGRKSAAENLSIAARKTAAMAASRDTSAAIGRRMAGWPAFPGAPTPVGHGPSPESDIAWAPVSGFKKIAENARKRQFQFPENRGKSGKTEWG